MPVLCCVYNRLICKGYYCNAVCLKANISNVNCSYMFDEPSSYLDVKQRLKAARAIRDLLAADR